MILNQVVYDNETLLYKILNQVMCYFLIVSIL